ncbi:Fc receptor-like B, partial [Megadyptes antipodes antipodes]
AGVPCHPTGTQTSQLTSDPPWTPVFLLEEVMLTCQGSGVPGLTEWYLDEQFWQRTRSDYIYVSKKHPGNNSYQCRSPGARLSPPITLSFSNDWLVLQVPVRALVEGDELLLRCRG